MDILDECVCYLIGGIEFMSDDGIGWRQKLIDMSWDNGVRVKFIDPCNKPVKIAGEIGPEKKKLQRLKEEGQWAEVKKIIHKIRRYDLRFVDYSDFLIVYIDPSVPTCGTWDEVFSAEDQKKPILVICKGGAVKAPVWLLDVVRTEEIFENLEDLVNHLVGINNGTIAMDDRWVLIRKPLHEFYDRQRQIQENRIRQKIQIEGRVLSTDEIVARMDQTGGQAVLERDLIATVKHLRTEVDKYKKQEAEREHIMQPSFKTYSKTCCGKPGDCNC